MQVIMVVSTLASVFVKRSGTSLLLAV